MPQKRTIPRVCRQCGGDFLASTSAVNSGKGLYCSPECRYASQRGRPTGKSRKLTVPCDHCGRKLTRSPSAVHGRNYCDPKCLGASRRPRPIPSPIASDDEQTALIPLLNRAGGVRAYATVDAADAEWVSQWRWHVDDDGYAVRETKTNGQRQRILLHRALLGLTPDDDAIEGDHIDRNRLNDRRSNLRAIPKAGNRQNVPGQANTSSRYRGVTWDRKSQKWIVQVMADKRNHVIGSFDDEDAAGLAAREVRQRLLPYAVD